MQHGRIGRDENSHVIWKNWRNLRCVLKLRLTPDGVLDGPAGGSGDFGGELETSSFPLEVAPLGAESSSQVEHDKRSGSRGSL